jgi:hypothetical protein
MLVEINQLSQTNLSNEQRLKVSIRMRQILEKSEIFSISKQGGLCWEVPQSSVISAV